MGTVLVHPIEGMGEIDAGTDLAAEILDAAGRCGVQIVNGDVVVVTSKIVSKAEGCVVDLEMVVPSEFAQRWAEEWDKDPRVVEVVLSQSKRIVRQVGPILISETTHGFVCANAGVDQSSSGRADRVLVLPPTPDTSARQIRDDFAARGLQVAVVITDTFGRPWRLGQTDVSIGCSGISPLRSYIGEVDPHGHEFAVQELCVVDEIASAAELVKGNTSRIPVAVVRNFPYEVDEHGSVASIIRDSSADLFR